ncbi:MAG: hypothetical protein QXK11_07130 [Pyrobaculum sp.]|uniref:hypothetical protein n=1 Tax=Pyrobaculum sp. TaxID=2004705 RepID=UPI00316CE3A6
MGEEPGQTKYAVYRGDGYIVVTDSRKGLRSILTKYNSMEYEKREKWLRQYGTVIEEERIMSIIGYYLWRCKNSYGTVKQIGDCVKRALVSSAEYFYRNLISTSVHKYKLERQTRKVDYIQLAYAEGHPALRYSVTINRNPKISGFRRSIWVWITDYMAISFSKEYLDMIESEPEKAIELATKFFKKNNHYLEDFMRLDFNGCSLRECGLLRELKMYLMLTTK